MSDLSPDRREALQKKIEELRKESRKLRGEIGDEPLYSGLTRGTKDSVDREICLLEKELREMS